MVKRWRCLKSSTPLLSRLKEWFPIEDIQITANKYLPGASRTLPAGESIPAHIDAHAPFQESVLSLSLLSTAAMVFDRPNYVRNKVISQ